MRSQLCTEELHDQHQQVIHFIKFYFHSIPLASTIIMQFTQLFTLLAGPAMVLATLDKCTTNTKGMYPKSPSCSAGKVSTSIQAAECAYNTRVSDQTFAVFETDHQYDDVYGAPYGTCSAYSCTAPDDSELTSGSDYWTFYWRLVSPFHPIEKSIKHD